MLFISIWSFPASAKHRYRHGLSPQVTESEIAGKRPCDGTNLLYRWNPDPTHGTAKVENNSGVFKFSPAVDPYSNFKGGTFLPEVELKDFKYIVLEVRRLTTAPSGLSLDLKNWGEFLVASSDGKIRIELKASDEWQRIKRPFS